MSYLRHSNGIVKCGPRKRVRRTWSGTLMSLLTLALLSLLAGWLLHVVRHAAWLPLGAMMRGQGGVPLALGAMPADAGDGVTAGALACLAMAVLLFGFVLSLVTCTPSLSRGSKRAERMAFGARFRAVESARLGDDVFGSLRESGGGVLTDVESRRILMACVGSLSAHKLSLHRALETLDVTQYEDELRVGVREIEAVQRCLTALAARYPVPVSGFGAESDTREVRA